MNFFSKKLIFTIILFISAVFFISLPQEASAGIVFTGKSGGSFTVYDRGTSRFKRLMHSDLYMSVKFDLVTTDVSNMIEPAGETTIHIAHYNDPEVKKLSQKYYGRIYSMYLNSLKKISAKMTETNSRIDTIKAGASRKLRKKMSSQETRAESRKWQEIDSATDDMTRFYDQTRDRLLMDIDNRLISYYKEPAYQKAEAANASYKIRLTRIKEIGLGCFSMAGSATRIAFGDIGSIISFLDQAKDLFLWCKTNFNRNAENLYDDYVELEEALNALARSIDETRISSNLSRVENAFNPYIKMTSKFNSTAIDRIMNIQQFFDQVGNIEDSLESLKTKHRIKDANLKKFASLKKELHTLKESQERIVSVATMIKEALVNSDEIRLRKNSLTRQKETELKSLENSRKSTGTRKLKGFGSIIAQSLTHIENVVSTVTQVFDASL